MQTLYPEQLNQYLERSGVPPVLLLFGDDLLLRMDAIDSIRQHFGQDAEKYHWIQSTDFDWKQLSELEQSMSLFGSNTLIELELPGAAAHSQHEAEDPDRGIDVIPGVQERGGRGRGKRFRVAGFRVDP